ncbi:beta-galactosidase-like [Lingula anatina]|uniref:Beta-galactosidase-like n=1 Tax=Lingula anatina TaxID=7574 RepID=A0A1S3IE04_LINAN|nr:beta-galactosidase-like [Lingula anatina]|eukprot:XP_013396462.1 beta-galactosidase-like [Lingula anatina]
MMLMSTVPNLLDKLTHHGPFVTRYPLTMEQVYQNYGFIYYRHVVKLDWHNAVLDVSAVRDRGYVLINSVPQGVVIRESSQTKLTITALTGQYLDILVENQGRINYGSGINNNTKGLIANVTINGLILKDWFIYPLNVSEKVLNNLDSAVQSKQSSPPKYSGVSQYITPSLFVGQIQMPNKTGFPQDTYLRTDGWFKGQAYVNGFNLGRYWPSAGPQLTLYVPKGALRPYPATNTLVLLELEYAPCSQTRNEIEVDYCFVEFVTTPVINATTVSLERREEWNRAGGFNWHDQH